MDAIRSTFGARRRLTLRISAAVLAVGVAVAIAIGSSGIPTGWATPGIASTGNSGHTANLGRTGGGKTSTDQSVPADAKQVQGCETLPDDIDAGAQVSAELVVKCDEREFGLSEGARQAARAKGKTVEVQTTSVCAPVNNRAADGDSTLDFGLAFHCRQQEQFANEVNVANGLAQPQLSSQCAGAQVRKQRGEKVDKFTQAMCNGEQAALGALGRARR